MVFGIRRRHEAEIVEFDVAETASEREILKSLGVASLTQFEKMHRLDPNMPIDELEQIDAAIREGNAEKGVEIEHLIVEDNSPYPEVRSTVRNYDVDLPANTIRAWVIGLVLCTIGSGVNMLFALRNPSVVVTTYAIQLVAYPIGRAWDLIFPDRTFNVLGLSFNLRPGKFNFKEHVIITVMSNAAYGGGSLYATDVIIVQQIWYKQFFGWTWQILFGITTLCMGYGLAGLSRRFLVWPASMIWPGTLVNCALFYTLHEHEKADPESACGWRIGRYKWFLIVFCSAFVWYWFPGWIFQGLSYFCWVTWLAPENVIVNQLFGGASGYGLLPISLDWTIISGYLGSPLIPPFYAIANTMVGLVVFFIAVSMGLHYSGHWYAQYLPVSSAQSFDNTGHIYNVSAILNENYHFDAEKYFSYSPLYLPTQFALAYGLAFATVSAIVVHVILYHGRTIKAQFTLARNQEDDSHMRMMKKYRDAEDWWYMALFAVMVALSFVVVCGWPTDFPWWALIVCLLIPIVFTIPIGIVQAITNIQLGLNVLTEYVVGYMLEGRPLAMMMFKNYGYLCMAQALFFASDMKLGHYMKVPPRTMFFAQLTASIWSAVIQIATMNWALSNIKDVCTDNQEHQYTCANAKVFYTASIIWGVIGPRRMFSAGALYSSLQWFWLLGAIVPVLTWLMARRYPMSLWRYIHVPLIFGGSGYLPPATVYIYLCWGIVGTVFNWFIKRRLKDWWLRYNYITSAALDTGLIISTIIIFFSLYLTETSAPKWFGNVAALSTLDMSTVHQPNNTSVNNEPFLRMAAFSPSNSTVGTLYLDLFLDTDLMITQINQAFSSIAALLVYGSMLDSRSDRLPGSLEYTRDRVQVDPATAFAITVLLLLCAIICVFVLVKRPKDIVPRDPRSIMGVALMTLSSRGWLELLSKCRFEHSEEMLRKQMFSSDIMIEDANRRFVIRRVDNGHEDIPESPVISTPRFSKSKRTWWLPLTLKTWVRLIAILLPIAVIGVLEEVQRLSDRQGGIMTVTDSNIAHYASTIIPALSMWGLAALHSSINFNTILLSPYFSLAKGHAHASRTVLSHNLGRLTLISLFASFKQRHVSAVFTGLAAVAGSFLTIVVSGLYFTSTESTTKDILVTRLDTFNTSWSSYGAYEDGGAGQLLSLIVWQNLSYPAWTYDDLAIPQLALSPGTTLAVAEDPEDQTFQVSVPARRAILACDANGPSNVTALLGPNTTTMIYTNITRTCPGSTGAPFAIKIVPKKQPVGFVGQMDQLVETQTTAQPWVQMTSTPPAKNDAGCQSLVFFLGSFPSSLPTTMKNVSASDAQITTLACTQLIQEVSVAMHLRADLTLDMSRPPSPDESTAHLVNDGLGDDASNVQEYMVSFPIGSFFQPITDDPAVLAALNSSAAAGNLDGFFQAVALGAGFFDIRSLVGEGNVQALINATSQMYGRYMAQVQSRTMRTSQDVSPGSQSQKVPATSTYTRTVLYQSRSVKLVLQIILGVMALCDCAAWLAMRGAHKLLPHDPGSVAGVAALVAGSDLWAGGERAAPMPGPPEWMSDEDVQTSGRWYQTRFVLREWPDGRYGVGVDTGLTEIQRSSLK